MEVAGIWRAVLPQKKRAELSWNSLGCKGLGFGDISQPYIVNPEPSSLSSVPVGIFFLRTP